MFKKLLVALLLGIAVYPVISADAVKTYVPRQEALAAAAKATSKVYPDADTVLVDDYEYIKYNADGTADCTDEMYEKILTEKGKRDNQEISMWFTLPYHKVSVPLLEVIKPDGKAVRIDVEKNSKVMVDPSQMSMNIYNPNSKIMRISIPDLQIGDTIHVIWKRNTVQPRMKGIWCEWYTLQSTNPIVRYTVEINGPAKRPLKQYMVKDPVKDSIDFKQIQKGDRIIYRWTARNVPRIFPEPDMPPYYTVCQRLLVSTADNWKEISKWYWDISKPHLDKTTPEMKKMVAELIKGKKTDYDKIYAIFQFVAKKIRYMGITTEKVAPGNEPHDVDITFNNRYGVCRDKAALLVAMLQIAGFKSYPVLFYNGPKKDPEVPNNYFNHAIVSVLQPDGKYLLMDPTDETTAELLPTYLCDKSYLPATPKGETLMTSAINPASKNMLTVNSVGRIAGDGNVEIITDMQFSGINDNVYRGAFSRWKKERVSQFIAGRLKAVVAGAEMKSLEITPADLRDMSKPLRIKLSFTASNYLIKSKDNTVLSPPWLGSYFGVVNFLLRGSAGLDKRQFPLKLYSTCGVKESFKLELPQDYPVAAMPKYKGVDTSTLAWNRDMKVKGRTVSGSSEFLIKAMEFTPKQYTELKDLLKKIEFEKRKLLIMQDPPLTDYPGAEAVILDEKSEISIKSNSEWVLRKYMKKKILTYAGVKNNSELKINYNPAWHKVKIVKAQTTSPDGQVKKLNDKELNIMDASWVASAPRYPAEKVMVASMPNVQTGSIVEYEIEHHFFEQPFFSTIAAFQKTDPIEKKIFKIIVPRSSDFAVQFDCLNSKQNNPAYVIKPSPNFATLYWEARDIDPVKSEPFSPPLWSFAKSVLVSNGNWKNYSEKLNTVFEQAIEQDDETSKLANELVDNLKIGFWSRLFSERDDRVHAVITIRDWVAKNIRSAGPGLNDLPLSAISPADKVLKDRYGNSADRAVLLTAMLRAIGFEANPVPVSSFNGLPEIWGKIYSKPQPVFDSVLVAVKLQDKTFYLNDTNQYAELGTVGHINKTGLDLTNGSPFTVHPAAVTLREPVCFGNTPNYGLNDAFYLKYQIKLQEDGLAAVIRSQYFFGSFYEEKKSLYSEITPENLRRRHQTLVSAIAQSAKPLSPLKTKFKRYPGMETFAVAVPGFAVHEGDYYYFELPGMDILKGLVQVAGQTRLNPYFLNDDYSFTIEYELYPPKGYSMTAMKPQFEEFEISDSRIIITDLQLAVSGKDKYSLIVKVHLKPTWIKVSGYPQLVDINAKLSSPKQKLIILKKIKTKK